MVNFFGGPSSGKTTAAADVFCNLKKLHIDCELVAEYPKDLVLEDNNVALANQIYVFANQLYRVECAYAHTRVAIVDSPLLLSTIYNNDKVTSTFIDLVIEQHKRFNNLNIVVRRRDDVPFSGMGRIHTLTESISIDNQIVELLDRIGIPYVYYDEWNTDALIEFIKETVNDTT